MGVWWLTALAILLSGVLAELAGWQAAYAILFCYCLTTLMVECKPPQ